MPFWIQTPTHPCTSHPLHSLEHNIYFHDLPFSLLSSLVSSQYLQNFWWFGWRLASNMGGVYAFVGGVTISDPDCFVTVGVMFWFAYFSVVFFYSQDLHKKEKTMLFEAHCMSFPCTELLLFNYAKVKTVFQSMAPLKVNSDWNTHGLQQWAAVTTHCVCMSVPPQ